MKVLHLPKHIIFNFLQFPSKKSQGFGLYYKATNSKFKNGFGFRCGSFSLIFIEIVKQFQIIDATGKRRRAKS